MSVLERASLFSVLQPSEYSITHDCFFLGKDVWNLSGFWLAVYNWINKFSKELIFITAFTDIIFFLRFLGGWRHCSWWKNCWTIG